MAFYVSYGTFKNHQWKEVEKMIPTKFLKLQKI